MSTFAFTDATIWVGGYDFTTDANEVTLDLAAEELDATTFGLNGYRARKGGLRNTEAMVKGFWDSATSAAPDPQIAPNLGTADAVVTVAADDAAASVAYMVQLGRFGYTAFGEIGQLTPFELKLNGTNAVGAVRGQVAAAKQSVSATGQLGSILSLGAPTTTQFVYATVHVFSAGTTITLQLQSDTGAGFASATTQATVGPLTAAGGTWMTRVAGPLAGETHWRFNVSAITGTFQVAAAIGVQ